MSTAICWIDNVDIDRNVDNVDKICFYMLIFFSYDNIVDIMDIAMLTMLMS